MASNQHVFGCIADDFTGASDAASFLQKAGKRVVLVSGIPSAPMDLHDEDAIVVALKTRTEPVEEAVAHSMAALQWLEKQGVSQFYFKYCSTFDSTPQGNIGPILDAALEYLHEPYSILCPALPVNGRIVKDGCLYVNGVPLHESHMKNHPLTPMWDCRIGNLMAPQSKYPCYEMDVNKSPRIEEAWGQRTAHYYIVPDYTTDADGRKIAEIFGNCRVLSGGSGILEHLSRTEHKGIVLAGSCSVATLEQIRLYQEDGHPSFRIDPAALLNGELTVDEIMHFISRYPDEYVLVYSSDTSDNVRKAQEYGREKVAALLEGTISEIAWRLAQAGYHHFIVAGGETSGAVTQRLGFSAFQIGKSVAPGVPLMIPTDNKDMRFVLKSGNFGQPDFFRQAIRIAKES